MRRLLCCLIVLLCGSVQAEIRVQDDSGDTVVLARPAQRVVSLAPHVTELLFAAGGGQRIVGAVRFSDFPPEARRIPRVGDNQLVDIERVLALRPELIVVWRHDAAARQLEQLRALGIPLYYSDPRRLEDLPRAVRQLGMLMGTLPQAQQAADDMTRRLELLAQRYRQRPRVRVFYQVWDRPLYTLNERHIVSDAIRLCGGENIFSGLSTAAPILAEEAVLEADPEVIISGESEGKAATGLALWKAYPAMRAVQRNNLFSIDADLVNRAGPRIIDGAERLCDYLERARVRRGEAK